MVRAALLLLALLATAAGTIGYRRIAIRWGIMAAINARTLHQGPVPAGAGVVFGAVFALAMMVAWQIDVVTTPLLLALGLGAAGAASIGLLDDLYEFDAPRKLALQAGLAVWLVATIYDPYVTEHLAGLHPVWRLGAVATLLFVPLWLINLYNFIDGVDGMASIGAVFVCAGAVLVLWATGGPFVFAFVFGLLGMSCLGFLILNLPPASVFMGDAGSITLGYCFAALAVTTVAAGAISAWTWIALLSYFIADTTTTTICRLVMVPRWYSEHRSHAYQNLARVSGSHAKVTYGVAGYHLFWALPLAMWSATKPHGAFAAALSLLPAVAWTLRFGPRFSSE